MKKLTRTMLVIAGLGTAAVASAAGTNFTSGALVDKLGTNGFTCALLAEGVTLNLSKNVSAAYSCDLANLDIRVSACHAAGSRKSTTMDCAVIGVAPDGTTPVFNDVTCDGTTGQQYTIADFRVFEGSSRGGTVAAANLGGPCTDGSVAGVPYHP